MAYRLFETNVEKACEKHWFANRSECNRFVAAVANELGILIPGSTAQADFMTWLTANFLGSPDNLIVPPGPHAAFQAMRLSNSGGWFVVAGMTRAELDQAHQLDWHPPLQAPQKVKHGHVAIVTRGVGVGGWPRGYWGSHGSVGGRNVSLSISFPHRHPELVHYFAWKIRLK